MNIQPEQFRNLNAVLTELVPGLQIDPAPDDWRGVENIARAAVTVIDALVKAENFCEKFNFQLPAGGQFFSHQPEEMIAAISGYLEKYPSSIFRFTKTERQTFLFVLENIADYFRSRAGLSRQRDGKQVFQDFRFWIENFMKIFDQKLNGEIKKVTESDPPPADCRHNRQENVYPKAPWMVFSSAQRIVPLYPFVVIDGGTSLFLARLTPDGPVYRKVGDDTSVTVKDRRLVSLLFEFALFNFDFSSARTLAAYGGNGVLEKSFPLDTIQTASELTAKGRFTDSYSLLAAIDLQEIDSPLLYQLQAKNLEGMDRRDDLQQLLLRLTAAYPQSSLAHEKLGDLYKRELKLEMAHNAYVKALNLTADKRLAAKLKEVKEALSKRKKADESTSNDTFYDLIDIVRAHPVKRVGRNKEFWQMVEILSSPGRNNVLIIGDSGVGKSTLIRALAAQVSDGNLPDPLSDRKIREINFVSLITGSKYRGQFEEKVLKVLKELQSQQAILILEDIHLMVSSGSPRGTSLDLVNMLKPFMRERSLQVIATTSYEEYKNNIEKDSVLMGFFQKVMINEMSVAETREILADRAREIAAGQMIELPDEILSDIAESARRNIKDRKLPDAALLVLERCVAKLKLKQFSGEAHRAVIDQNDVVEVLSDMLNLPEAQVSITMRNRLQRLRHELKEHIVGQDEAIHRISASVATSKLNLDIKSNRPDGVFLFVGPTGVGKTETAIALTKALYGSEEFLIRIDMSEYMERFTYSRFVGAAPGYVGYYDSNQLTDRVRQNPFSVILLDEFEKADTQLLNIFLQVFDAGRLTDARGNLVDFSHTTIIMTSNVGTSLFSQSQMGYQSELAEPAVSRSALVRSLKRFFSPEFLNRIDEIVVFNKLQPEDIRRIIDLQLTEVRGSLERQGKRLILEPAVITHIIDRYYSAEYGARNISRGLKTDVLEQVAGLLLSEEWPAATGVIGYLDSEEIRVRLNGEDSAGFTVSPWREKEEEQ